MDIISLIISLISGVAGGNAAGAALKNTGLTTVVSSLTGLVGGGLGGALLPSILGMPATPREGWMPARCLATSSAAAWVAHC